MNTPEFTRELSPRVVPPDPLASAVGRSLDAMVQRPTAGVEPGQNLPVAGGSGSPPNGEPPVARRQDRDNSDDDIWPANEPVVRIGRGIREQGLAEQNVEHMWGMSSQAWTDGEISRPSQLFPAGRHHPSPDQAQGFREAVVTLMDDIMDARIDFSSELGQQII